MKKERSGCLGTIQQTLGTPISESPKDNSILTEPSYGSMLARFVPAFFCRDTVISKSTSDFIIYENYI